MPANIEVEIPGYGIAEFPPDFSEDQIRVAIERDLLKRQSAAPAATETVTSQPDQPPMASTQSLPGAMANAAAQAALRGTAAAVGMGGAALQEGQAALRDLPGAIGMRLAGQQDALQPFGLAETMKRIRNRALYRGGEAAKPYIEAAYPVAKEQAGRFPVELAAGAGSFVPLVASGPAAPLAIGLQSLGEHLSADWAKAKAAGATDEDAAGIAMRNGILSGAAQVTIFSVLPKPLKSLAERFLISKFGPGAVSQFVAGRIATGLEGGALGAASNVAEDVVTGQPVSLKQAAASGAGLGALNLVLPYGRKGVAEGTAVPQNEPSASGGTEVGGVVPAVPSAPPLHPDSLVGRVFQYAPGKIAQIIRADDIGFSITSPDGVFSKSYHEYGSDAQDVFDRTQALPPLIPRTPAPTTIPIPEGDINAPVIPENKFSVPPEHPGGDQGGKTAETSGRNRLLSPETRAETPPAAESVRLGIGSKFVETPTPPTETKPFVTETKAPILETKTSTAETSGPKLETPVAKAPEAIPGTTGTRLSRGKGKKAIAAPVEAPPKPPATQPKPVEPPPPKKPTTREAPPADFLNIPVPDIGESKDAAKFAERQIAVLRKEAGEIDKKLAAWRKANTLQTGPMYRRGQVKKSARRSDLEVRDRLLEDQKKVYNEISGIERASAGDKGAAERLGLATRINDPNQPLLTRLLARKELFFAEKSTPPEELLSAIGRETDAVLKQRFPDITPEELKRLGNATVRAYSPGSGDPARSFELDPELKLAEHRRSELIDAYKPHTNDGLTLDFSDDLKKEISRYTPAFREFGDKRPLETVSSAVLESLKARIEQEAGGIRERRAKESAAAEKAAAEMEHKFTRVVKTEPVQGAVAVKNTLVRELEKALEEAPMEAAGKAKLTIDIPGDGTFTIANHKAAIQEVLDRARRIPTGTAYRPYTERPKPTREEGKQFLAEAEQLAKTEPMGKPLAPLPKLPMATEAADIIARLEAKKIKPGDKQLSTLLPGLDPETARSAWNTGIDIAITAIKAGRAVAEALDKAIEHIRAAVKGAKFDEAAARLALAKELPPTAPPTGGTPSERPISHLKLVQTQMQGAKFNVTSATKVPVDKTAGIASALDVFKQAGLRATIGQDGRVHLEDGDGWPPRHVEGQKLLSAVNEAAATARQLTEEGAPPNDRHVSLLDSVRKLAMRMREMEKFPERFNFEQPAFDPVTVRQLLAIGQGEASEAGRLLQLYDSGQRDFVVKMKDVDVELETALGDSFGGNIVRKVLHRAITHFRDFFTDNEVNSLTAKSTELSNLFDALAQRLQLETGGRVYRMAQAQLKPQIAKTLKWMESNAQTKEAVAEIIQQFERMRGKVPAKKPGKLTPHEQLILLSKPETVAKLNAAIEEAVRQAERNAAREIIVRDKALADDELALYDERTRDPESVGPDPTDAQVSEGLQSPKFAHWKVIRDNLLGYSPVTDALIRKVVKGDYRGTKFEQPGAPKPADTRIDLRALAKQPDAEVQRVMDAHAANLEAELAGATPEARSKILGDIRTQVLDQLSARRKEFLDNFFTPQQRIPTTASDKLRQLINVGVTKDPRFGSDKIRQLVKRILAGHVDADSLADLATRPRQEKRDWLERSTNVTLAAEKLMKADVPPAMADYAEAVARTYLAERLQAAEEKIARSFLSGADTQFQREPVTPEERTRRQQEAKAKLEGLIRAGSIDTPLVETAARKGAFAKFTPSLPDMVKTLLSTPFYRHTEIGSQFAARLVDELNIDRANRDKAESIFRSAFDQKLRVASELAAHKSIEALTPQEKKDLPAGKPIWKRLIQAVNAKGFDPFDSLVAISKDHDWNVNEADIAQIKALAEREQRLRGDLPKETLDKLKLTQDQLDEYERTGNGLAPEEAVNWEIARINQLGLTATERGELQRRMVTLWSRMTRPFGLKTHEGRKNTIPRLLNELVPINLLTRWLFAPVQTLDVTTQNLLHTTTTAAAHAVERAKLPDSEKGLSAYYDELSSALGSSLRTAWQTAGSGLSAARQAIRTGRGLPTRVEGITSGLRVWDRLQLKGEELAKSADPVKRLEGLLIRFGTWGMFGTRLAGALDLYQSSPGRFKEFQGLIKTYLRAEHGLDAGTAGLYADWVLGDINSEYNLARAEAPGVLQALGIKETNQGLNVSAWNAVWERMLARANELGLPTEDFREAVNKRLQTLGWNRPEDSVFGKLIRVPARGVEELAANAYIPTGGTTSFANATAYALVQKLQNSPLGFVESLYKGSPTAETQLDRTQIKVKAAIGTAIGLPLAALVATGAWKAITHWPDDEKEREKMKLLGLRPGVVLVPIGGGRLASISIQSSPLGIYSLPIAFGAAIREVLDKHEHAQAKANAEAAKHGLQAGKLPDSSPGEFALTIMGRLAMDLMAGTRTSSGKIGTFSDYGQIISDKAVASYVSALIPFAPLYQNTMRILGTELDPKLAGAWWNQIFPRLNDDGQRINDLGDTIKTRRDASDIAAMITRGTGKIVDMAALQSPYAAVIGSGYTPPAISSSRGYNFNGVYRPMDQAELQRYTRLRGQYFKQELSGLNGNASYDEVQAAFKVANQQALSEMGVTVETASAQPAASAAAVSAPNTSAGTGRVSSSIGGPVAGAIGGRLTSGLSGGSRGGTGVGGIASGGTGLPGVGGGRLTRGRGIRRAGGLRRGRRLSLGRTRTGKVRSLRVRAFRG